MSADTFGGGPQRGLSNSGPLSRGGSGGGKGEAPNLADYPDEPQYDLATVVQLVGVRPMTLWAWEQQLGIPRPERVGESSGGTVRHYSERDLVASIWLRDQILAGVPPAEAAALLISAQRAAGERGPGTRMLAPAPERFRVNSGPLGQASGAGRRSGPLTGGLSGPPSRPGEGPPTGGFGRTPSSSPWSGYISRPSGPLRGSSGTNWSVGPTSQPPAPSVAPGMATGALRGGVSGRLNATARGPDTTNLGWPSAPPGTGRELRSLVPQLAQAFMTFDSFTANRIVEEALSVRQVETVYLGLLQPALTRVNELGTRHDLSIPEERYAVNFVRARLFTIFTNTPERADGPTAIVACGPREQYDVGALMLATFWRRAGLQVVFLGADVSGPALVQAIYKRRPRVVCVAVSATQRLRALSRVAKEVAQMDPPAPFFTYSGAIFARNPELKRKVAGVYLGDDPATATWQVMRLLGLELPAGAPAGPYLGSAGRVS
jgi:methanogenic corrinoid protein MtbC1/DNA-binding transcriptional MerR regulator